MGLPMQGTDKIYGSKKELQRVISDAKARIRTAKSRDRIGTGLVESADYKPFKTSSEIGVFNRKLSCSNLPRQRSAAFVQRLGNEAKRS